MARTLADILRRFRPAVAPGPAAPAGVPADRVMEAEAELAVVFAALAPAVTEASTLVEQARADAEHRRQAGVGEAQRIVADARARLESVRAEAASTRLAELDAERMALETQTRVEVGRVGEVAAARVPSLVSAVLDGIWATAGLGPSGPLSGAGLGPSGPLSGAGLGPSGPLSGGRDGPTAVDAGSEGRTA